jgi:RNA 2',3'-cyclic 3'-phosphodiesterase
MSSFDMRIFIALDIDEAIRDRIARFLDGVRGFAPDARWVRPESLHVTLKFIGETAPEDVDPIKEKLKAVEANAIEMNIRGSGFFPGAKSPRVFWLGIEAGPSLAELASTVDDRVAALGIAKEDHPFSPHLTLARGGGSAGSPRSKSDGFKPSFQRLQEKLAALPVPEFGTMTAREFFLYQSHLSRGGSRYEKLASFTL